MNRALSAGLVTLGAGAFVFFVLTEKAIDRFVANHPHGDALAQFVSPKPVIDWTVDQVDVGV